MGSDPITCMRHVSTPIHSVTFMKMVMSWLQNMSEPSMAYRCDQSLRHMVCHVTHNANPPSTCHAAAHLCCTALHNLGAHLCVPTMPCRGPTEQSNRVSTKNMRGIWLVLTQASRWHACNRKRHPTCTMMTSMAIWSPRCVKLPSVLWKPGLCCI